MFGEVIFMMVTGEVSDAGRLNYFLWLGIDGVREEPVSGKKKF